MFLFLHALALAQEPAPDVVPAPPPADAPPVAADATTAEPAEARATALYLEALQRWQRGDVSGADKLAAEALGLDPDFVEAKLLYGFTQSRLGNDAGVESLKALAADPLVDPEVQARAARVAGRITDRYRRDQVTAMAGWGLGWERRYDVLSSEVDLMIGVEVPVWRFLRIRAEGVFAPFDGEELGLDGPIGAIGPSASLPLGKGVWSLEGAVGLAFWGATGPYWQEGGELQVGARVVAGIDVRPWRRVGLGLDVGTNVWPGLWVELPWYGQPVDARLMMKIWLGKSRV